VSDTTIDDELDNDMLLYGDAFERIHSDGTRERLDPTRVIIHRRTSDGAMIEELVDGFDGLFKQRWAIPPPDIGISYRVVREEWEEPVDGLPIRTIHEVVLGEEIGAD